MIFLIKDNTKTILKWLVLFSLCLLFLRASPVEAVMYLPGATLEPACAPTDANCGVISNVAAYFTATSTDVASTFPYASSTALTISGNSYLGTILSAIWNGSTIGVGYGGTGQTSFGQGWLNSNGTTLSASTSPTVNYITATSTTATSTFPTLKVGTALQIGSDYITDITGSGLSVTNGVLSSVISGSMNIDQFSSYKQENITILYASSTSGSILVGNDAGRTLLNGYDNFTSSTAVGNSALYSNTTGYNNTANGSHSLYSNTTGYQNTAVGYDSLYSNTTGYRNTAVGYITLTHNTTGLYNTAVGYASLYSNTTGYENTANGIYSLFSNTTGYHNTANGHQTLYSNTIGYQNTANGIYSLYNNTIGYRNTANGTYSLNGNITGYENTANGTYSLYNNDIGYENTANGYASLFFNTTGYENTANGYASLNSNTTGIGNIGIGFNSGRGDGATLDQRSVIDNYMTFIGYQASRSEAIASTIALTNGTAIGKNARVAQSNSIILGGTGADAVNVSIGTTSPWAKLSIQNTYGLLTPLFDIATTTSLASATTSIFRVNADGNIGIGTTSPNWKLSVAGIGSFDDYVRASYFIATSTTVASILSYASTTALSVSGGAWFTGGSVGIGTSSPSRKLDVVDSANPQLRLSQSASVYTDFSVAPSTGDLTLNLNPGSSADDIFLTTSNNTGANLWICENSTCPSGISFSGGGNLFVEGNIKYATSTSLKTRRTIILTAAGGVTPATGGASKTQVDGTNHSYYVLDFDPNSDNASYWQWTMPDSYDNGPIDVTYYWEAGATSGDAIFCFQSKGIAANNAEDIDSALSSAVCQTDTAQSNANDLASITEVGATSNFTKGEYVTLKVFRDADAGGDTMSGNARLVKVKVEYGVDSESD